MFISADPNETNSDKMLMIRSADPKLNSYEPRVILNKIFGFFFLLQKFKLVTPHDFFLQLPGSGYIIHSDWLKLLKCAPKSKLVEIQQLVFMILLFLLCCYKIQDNHSDGMCLNPGSYWERNVILSPLKPLNLFSKSPPSQVFIFFVYYELKMASPWVYERK